jgi:hypothetical protein
MTERAGLGSLGRRLLAALMLTAGVAILAMVVGMLLTEQRVRAHTSDDLRLDLARTLAASAAVDYTSAGGWAGVDLDAEQAGADVESLHLVVRDAEGKIVLGGPVGANFYNRAVAIAAMDTGTTLFFDHRDPAMVSGIGNRPIHD